MTLLEAVKSLTEESTDHNIPGHGPWFISYRNHETGESIEISLEQMNSDKWGCATRITDDIFNHKLKKFMKRLAEE